MSLICLELHEIRAYYSRKKWKQFEVIGTVWLTHGQIIYPILWLGKEKHCNALFFVKGNA